jgi:hypothetical protein
MQGMRQIALPPGRQLRRHVRLRRQKMSAIQAAGTLTQSQPAGRRHSIERHEGGAAGRRDPQ